MKKNAVLRQLLTNHEKNPMRNPERPIRGWYAQPPEVGQNFEFRSVGLESKIEDDRRFTTSEVQQISETESGFDIVTMNSVYRVENDPPVIPDDVSEEDRLSWGKIFSGD